MKKSLEFKITGLIVSAVFVGAVIAGVLTATFIKSDMFTVAKKYSEKYSDITASMIKHDIEDSMLAGKGDVMKAVVDRYRGADKRISILVLDPQGMEAFNKEGRPIEADAVNKIKETEAPLVQITSDVIHFYKPLINSEKCIKCHSAQGKILGVVKVSILLPLELAYEMGAHRIRIALIGLISGVLFLGALLWFILRKVVISPVKQIEDAAKHLSEGDLSFHIDIHSKDEIGRLSQDIRTAVRGIGNILTRIKGLSGRILKVSEDVERESKNVVKGAEIEADAMINISNSVEELNATVIEIADNTEDLASSMEKTSASIEQMVSSISIVNNSVHESSAAVEAISSSIEELSITIKEVASNAEELSVASEETLSAISEIASVIKEVELSATESARLSEKVTSDAATFGIASVEKTIEGMKNIKSSVEYTADLIKRLGSRSEEIGKILTVIDEVTDQTALLALNAAILAAQAGEHGKGFSVVADEIKDLAERTASSTEEIATLIKSVQQEVRNANESMQEELNSVGEGFRLAKEGGDALGKILESSKKSSEMAISIERSTTEQSKAARLIAEAMERVRNMTDHIAKATQEQSKGAAMIMKAAEKMRDISRQVSKATEEQAISSHQISEAIEIVSERSQQISRSLSEHRIGTKQILDNVYGVKGIPEENRKLAFRVNNTIRELHKASDLLNIELEQFKLYEGRNDVLRFGVLPLESPAVMFKKFVPLVDYLSGRLGKKVELKVAVDFESALTDISQNITQLCPLGPITYIEAHKKYGVRVLVKALREGKPYHRSVIITKADSDIKSLKDLKGRTFAFGNIQSASGHIYPRLLLKDKGIDLKDLRYYHHFGYHDDVSMAVLKGDFDAGGVMESTAYKFKDQGLKFLQFSEEIPEFNISYNSSMDEREISIIKTALLSLNGTTDEGRAILKSIDEHYTGFAGSDESDYNGVRLKLSNLGIFRNE